jgi:hypothetical protein
MGGPALIPTTRKLPPAHLASLMSCVGNPAFDKFSSSLQMDASLCHAAILSQGHINNYDQDHFLAAALPVDEDQILSINFAPEAVMAFHSIGLNSFLIDYLNVVCKQDLQKLVIQSPTDDCGNTDAVHFLTLTTRSMSSRIFNVDLSQPFYRIEALRFIAVIAFLAGQAPKPTPLATFRPGFDYPMGTCFKDKQFIDGFGNHRGSCVLGKSATGGLHKEMTGVFKYFAERAGLITKCPPNLQYIIGEDYSPTFLGSIFPKKPTPISKSNHKLLTSALKQIQEVKEPSKKLLFLKATLQNVQLLEPQDCAAVQPDLAAKTYSGKGVEQLIDTTLIHTSCASYAKDQRFFLTNLVKEQLMLFEEGSGPAVYDLNTPAVVTRAKAKHSKYDDIEHLANLQAAAKQRKRKVAIVPAVVSHRGELGSELHDLIEEWTACYRAQQRKVFDFSGKSLVQRTSDFRRDFKNSIILKLTDLLGVFLTSAWAAAFHRSGL